MSDKPSWGKYLEDGIENKLTHTEQVNNQIQLATIISAHYSTARQAIIEWIKRRDQYIAIYLSSVGAISAFYLNSKCNLSILTITPIITILALLAYTSADIHISYLSRWLIEEYSEILEGYASTYKTISLAECHWDKSRSLRSFYSDNGASIRYIFLGTVFILPNLLGVIWSCYDKCGYSIMVFILSVVALVASSYFTFRLYRKRKDMATY